MKKIKHLVAFLLIAVYFFLLGETSTLIAIEKLSYSCDSVSYQISEIDRHVDFGAFLRETTRINKVINSSKASAFVLKITEKSGYETEAIIYCDPDERSSVEKAIGLDRTEYRSMLLSNLKIEYRPFKSLDNLNKQTKFCYFGDESDVEALKKKMAALYSVYSVSEATDSSDIAVYVRVIAGVMLLFIFMLSLYDVQSTKREAVIRFTFGESNLAYIGRNIAVSSVIYIVSAVSIYAVLIRYNSLSCETGTVMISVLSVIVADSIPYISLISFRCSDVIKGSAVNEKVAGFSLMLKLMMTALLLFAVNMSAEISSELKGYYMANALCNIDGSYYFADLMPDPTKNGLDTNAIMTFHDDAIMMNESIYRNKSLELDPIILTAVDTDCDVLNYRDSIYANRRGAELLAEMGVLPASPGVEADITVYLHDDGDGKISKRREDIALGFVSNTEGASFEFSHKTVLIDKDYAVAAVCSEKFGSLVQMKNCPIIVNNVEPYQMKNDIMEANKLNLYHTFMYKIDENTKRAILSEYDFDFITFSNCRDMFSYYMRSSGTTLIFMLIFLLSLLLINILLVITITREHFILNRIILCLKFLHGRSFFDRYSSNFISMLLMNAIAALAVVILLRKGFHLADNSIMILFCAGLTVTEFIIFAIYALRLEKENISKVLKGDR